MYSVEWEPHALDQLSALPSETFPFFAELVTVLEVAPWSGDAYDRQRPDANMRARAFGAMRSGISATPHMTGPTACHRSWGRD